MYNGWSDDGHRIREDRVRAKAGYEISRHVTNDCKRASVVAFFRQRFLTWRMPQGQVAGLVGKSGRSGGQIVGVDYLPIPWRRVPSRTVPRVDGESRMSLATYQVQEGDHVPWTRGGRKRRGLGAAGSA